MRKIYTALDIGSNYIKLIVGEFINNKLNILCAKKGISRGFYFNQITDEDKLVKSINAVLEEAELELNFKIKNVILNIPTDYNEFTVTDATNEITNEEKIVESTDILKVLQASSYNRIKPNDELIGAIPIMFKVGDYETESPLNKRGKNISVKSVLVSTDKKKVYDLVKLIQKCNLEVVDITTTGMTDYYNFKTSELDSKNVIIVNLGDSSTNISVYSKGIYINNVTLDQGGYDIDKLISETYNVRRKDANYLKENLSLASLKNADVSETLTVVNKLGEEITVNQYELTTLVAKKVEDILKLVKKNVNLLTKKEISYIIITGGLSEIRDLSIPVNNIFATKGRIGKINNVGARDNAYSVSLGMLTYFNSKLVLRNKDYSTISESDLNDLCSHNSKVGIASDSILGKVFSYFFDN